MPEKDENTAQKPLRISWWKLAVGLVLVLIEIQNWLTPNQDFPDALRASNEAQQGVIYLVSFGIFLVGIGFIVAGLRALWLRRS